MSNNAHHRETRFTKNITKRYERVQSPMGMREVSGRKVSGCLLYGSVSHRDRWELGNCAWTVIPGEERASAPWGKNRKEDSRLDREVASEGTEMLLDEERCDSNDEKAERFLRCGVGAREWD